ncbi:AAA family ATPase [Paenimyroides tangerinum]|uniref:AAA family ATPase n=1 Tax=Paenimyroides tangerinum TaxID=2488728 RepID=A0A3P3VZR6_9FLAO|nr:AAA domain-containing protein [Paenimyroides tangerinum]RRJ87116.1 AAA family ATPase [Paenimyroides tangerinum]
MQNFSSELFNSLQTKLKTGNRRGVHLNAIPGNSRYKFDLARFSHIFKSLPERFILDLLTQRNMNFRFSIYDRPNSENENTFKKERLEIDFDSEIDNGVEEITDENHKKISQSIENLIFQNEVIESEKGINTLGFGFPILVRRDLNDGQITAAPILIWTLKIKQVNEINTWEISRTEDDPIYLNEVLINHLQSDCGITLEKISDEMLEDGKIDKTELHQICTKILEQLKIQQNIDFLLSNYEEIPLIKPKSFYDEKLVKKRDGLILKSGIFSLFEVQKQNIINDYEALKTSFVNQQTTENSTFQTLSAVGTDPSQQRILENLKFESNILIQGPPGTGKSQTLTALLINALENKQKTIVVCEKQTALEVLHNALQTKGLGQYCVLIKDSVSDRKTVVNAVREIIDNPGFKREEQGTSAISLQNLVTSLNETKENINGTHHKLNSVVIENKNWADIVGAILQYKREKTDIDLENFTFQFSNEEFTQLLELIEKGQPLFEKYKPFQEQTFLDWQKLIAINYYSTQENIDQAFGKYQKEWNEIETKISNYKMYFNEKRKIQFVDNIEKINKIINEVELINVTLQSNSDVFDLEKTNGFWYKFTSIFSSTKKKNIQNQKRLQELSLEIKQISQEKHLESIEISADIRSNVSEILKYKSKVDNAKNQFVDNSNSEFEGLDFLNIYDKSIINSETESIANQIKNLINALKNDGILQKVNIENNFSDLKKYVENQFSSYKSYKSNNENPFLIEFNWFVFYYNLNDFQKNILEKLKPIEKWEASLLSIYYSKLLHQHSDESLLIDLFEYNEFSSKMNHFNVVQSDFIKYFWNQSQREIVKKFETINKEITVANLYNKRSSTNHKRLTLRQIVARDIDVFTTFFPIILITPDSCSNLFQGKNFYFDNVVFDEASQLKLEDNLPAMLKGKNIIIAGDEHQMPPSNYFSRVFDGSIEDEDDIETENTTIESVNAILNIESLLDYALEFNFDKNYLDFHYRSKHPYLIDFSNAAFYQSRLKPLPAKSSEKPIKFYQVNGIFEEHINEEEAEKVIEILKNIKPSENGNYPSVGIATFNITQRNYIKRKINHLINQEGNESFREQISALEQAGLFIKNLENIQGDERDIIIISTTYGRKKNGKFVQSFGPINHTKGYKLLNVIITRAKEKIYICNSIPEEFYLNYSDALKQEKSNNRKAALYAYLAYCKAVSDEDEQKRLEVLNELTASNLKSEAKNLETNNLLNEVYSELKTKYPNAKIIKNHQFGGYLLDILFEMEGRKPIAIECLSKPIYVDDLAYLEDMHKEKILKLSGYDYHRIWSQNCWQNLNTELNKLK